MSGAGAGRRIAVRRGRGSLALALRLVVKDLAVARIFLLIGIPLSALQLFTLAVSPPAFFLLTSMLAGLLGFGSLAIEETQGTEPVWCSLPVSRRGIVFARYLTTLLGIFGGLGIAWAVGRLAAWWPSGGAEEGAAGVPLAPFGAIAVILLLAGALLLPAYFRLGAGRALVLSTVLMVGLLLVSSLVGWVVVWATGDPLLFSRECDAETLDQVRAWLELWGGLLEAGVVAGALAIYAASAPVAARLYERRDW